MSVDGHFHPGTPQDRPKCTHPDVAGEVNILSHPMRSGYLASATCLKYPGHFPKGWAPMV
jgi:hypothetical protein